MHQERLDFELEHARVTDPDTSRAAARSMRRPSELQREIVLGVLRRSTRPLTAAEIAARAGLTMEQVCRRLADAESRALAETTGETRPTPTGRPARCWRLKGAQGAG